MRQQVRHVLGSMDPSDAERKSLAAVRALVALEEFSRAKVIMSYLPMPEEVDTTAIALAAWDAGKTLLVPRCHMEPRRMDACQISSFKDGLSPSYYGVLEPTDADPWPIDQIDFIVVPALAFDRSGGRLGRGAGFYDRFLSQVRPDTVACGIAFSEQLLDSVPVMDHDERVDLLVTDQEVLDFRRPC